MTSPRVSVLMPVYNGERFLREAVESILGQTFTDFEFIIVDDGSTDGTKAILDSYTDPRIVRLTNKTNRGLVASLNRGLKAARGTYIARMDADDISLPARFEKQIEYLGAHPDIGVLGTDTILIDEEDRILAPHLSGQEPYTSTPGVIHWRLFFHCPIAHPTVLLRRSLLDRLKGYDPRFKHAEDYELWLRASAVTCIANLPIPLVKVRLHSGKVSHMYSRAQQHSADRAAQMIISSFLGQEVPLLNVSALRNWHYIKSGHHAIQVAFLLERIFTNYTRITGLNNNEYHVIQDDVAARLSDIMIAGIKYHVHTVKHLVRVAFRLPLHSQLYCYQILAQRMACSASRCMSGNGNLCQ